MGTWNTKITGNDTALDIYSNFFDLYNEGANPTDVTKRIKKDFQDYFNDSEDRINSFLGLALAQW
jgi:transcription elongation factor Elf1